MPYATAADVAVLLARPLTVAEEAKADVLLPVADAKILQAVPSVPARITAGTLAASLVGFVAASMVARALTSTDGVTATEEQIDDYRRVERRDVTDRPTFSLTDDELDLLRLPDGDTTSAAAFTIKPYAVPRPRRPLDSCL